MATFVLGGLWHGAAWTFVFWGFLHGLALIIQRMWSKLGIKLWTWIAWLITFNFVNITWVFFRAKEWDDAVNILSSMFSLDNVVFPGSLKYIDNLGLTFSSQSFLGVIGDWEVILFFISMSFLYIRITKNWIFNDYKNQILTGTKLGYSILLFIFSIASLNEFTEFLYFNF